jgi:hypothetical protein
MLLLPRVAGAGIHGDGYAESRLPGASCTDEATRIFRIMELLFQHT